MTLHINPFLLEYFSPVQTYTRKEREIHFLFQSRKIETIFLRNKMLVENIENDIRINNRIKNVIVYSL